MRTAHVFAVCVLVCAAIIGMTACEGTTGVAPPTEPPAAPTLAMLSPAANSGDDNTPTVRVTVDATQQSGVVQLFLDDKCTDALSDTVAITGATVDVSTYELTDGETVSIYAMHTNSAGYSTCSETSVTYVYITADPPLPPIVRGTDTVPGLNDIPMDRLLLTSGQEARNIVVLEGPSHSIDVTTQATKQVVPSAGHG